MTLLLRIQVTAVVLVLVVVLVIDVACIYQCGIFSEKPAEKAPSPTEKHPVEDPQPASNPPPAPGPLNRKSYQPRLGLARVYRALGRPRRLRSIIRRSLPWRQR